MMCNRINYRFFKSDIYYTDQAPYSRGQYDGQGVYYGLSSASEVFLISTTQLYAGLCNYNAELKSFHKYLDQSIATGILPTPNTPLCSHPVGSKCTSSISGPGNPMVGSQSSVAGLNTCTMFRNTD